ncbi:nucleoside triphosphate pyrophosphohydrolase [Parvibaculum sp.]|uniref:nucleoside triphosphate pyrophosphohydrolase n=1 Tax=Parvibaculum sp. TaxID=2024848 RepID=UPI002CDB5ED1|nr:nucleoside triphosphate pyrophosphohydrolase [Parvibaculum sp.]HUD52952.1 nucleoside triphosphate pyrophosphohydrolase [Parvibaculum sp.]
MSDTSDFGRIDALLAIMAKLRSPEGGCPWDLEQNFATIAPYTIEEAYEVADAIEQGDMGELRDELGDLLFQVVFHAQMASEAGSFTFEDVVRAICEKMIRRHPHVFGDETARSAGAVKGRWEEIKAEEKAARGKPARESILDDVPLALPALTRAVKLQARAARVGFDWPSTAEVLDKLNEEMLELSEELTKGGDRDRIEDEFGDLLFVYANLARHLKIDPEAALRRTNAKFRRRFGRIEEKLAAKGISPEQSTLEEMDALWNEAKREERG